MGKEMDNLPRTALLTGIDKRYSFHQKLRELVGDSDAEGSSSLSLFPLCSPSFPFRPYAVGPPRTVPASERSQWLGE